MKTSTTIFAVLAAALVMVPCYFGLKRAFAPMPAQHNPDGWKQHQHKTYQYKP